MASDSPPSGVRGYTQRPRSKSDPVELPDNFEANPRRQDPATSEPQSDQRRANPSTGRPSGVQTFGTGAEQRGTSPETRQVTAGPNVVGEKASQPEGVQSFDEGAAVGNG